MKARLLIIAIVLFIGIAGFDSAAGNTQTQKLSQKKADVVTKEPVPEKALEEATDEAAETNQAEDGQAKKNWSFTYGGEITNYFVSESSAFFGESGRQWLETSLRLDGTAKYKNFTAGVSGLGIKTTGHDSYGTGTLSPFATPGTNRPSALPSFYLDKAYIQLDRIGGLPLKATLGRQHIQIGSQFLFGDGVYDGFSAKTRQGVFHNPRKGFDALRVDLDVKKTHFDSFIYRVDPTWDGGGGRDGLLGGLDVSHTFAKTNGTS